MIGREGDNEFSSVSKLADMTSMESDVTQHPVYGLKSNLIRLLANAVHKNKYNQDLVHLLSIFLTLQLLKVNCKFIVFLLISYSGQRKWRNSTYHEPHKYRRKKPLYPLDSNEISNVHNLA